MFWKTCDFIYKNITKVRYARVQYSTFPDTFYGICCGALSHVHVLTSLYRLRL